MFNHKFLDGLVKERDVFNFQPKWCTSYVVKEQLTKPLVFKTCPKTIQKSSEWSPMVKWNDNLSKLLPIKKWFDIFIWQEIAKQKSKSNFEEHAWTNLLENTQITKHDKNV